MYTDEQGEYFFPKLESGQYRVWAQAKGYETIESTTAEQGSYTAPFPGIHGWYWLNLSEEEPISVTLTTTGFYSYAMEFRADSRRRYEPDAIEVPSGPGGARED